MRCNLCQLMYETVDGEGLCSGCAADMQEAEDLLRSMKVLCPRSRAYAGSNTPDSQDQVEDPSVLCFDLDFAEGVFEYGSLQEAVAA